MITAEPRANLIRPEIDECKHRAIAGRASEDQEKAGMDSLDRYEAEDTPLNWPQFICSSLEDAKLMLEESEESFLEVFGRRECMIHEDAEDEMR